jgi:glycosyltransferase involved in cell wall biosynthesis
MTRTKLRVLHVGKYYPPTRGGMETSLEVLCQGLKNVVDLQVLVANETTVDIEENIDGVAVRRLGSVLRVAGSPICPGLLRAMRQASADLVHIHLPHPVALLTYFFGGMKTRLVCTYHSDIVRQRVLGGLLRPLQNQALREAAAIISASPNLIDSSPVLRLHRERCVVIPFGIDSGFGDALDGNGVQALRQKFAPPILLAVGRLVYYKGFQTLIRAFAAVKEPCTLLIIGDGPLRQALQTEITALGITGRVHLLGNVPDTVPYYHACDIFVLPSIARSEAFGIVQLEAMACGKPVINTGLDTGVPFVSRHQETGLTVPPANIPALAQAIEHLLNNSDLRARYGQAARERVRNEFTVQKMMERTLAVYQAVALNGTP